MASVLAYSFGEEGVDRYIMLFKREHAPSEDQLNTLRKGEEWNEEVAKRLKEEREMKAKEEIEYAKSRKRKENFVPNSYYKDKYQHLIGKEAALEAARKTEANSSYGCGGYRHRYKYKLSNFHRRHELFLKLYVFAVKIMKLSVMKSVIFR